MISLEVNVPLNSAEIETCAEQLADARARHRLILTPAARLDSVDDAYLVQDAIARRLGGVHGWKVGAKSSSDVPVCAPLVAHSIVEDSGNKRSVGSEHIGVELEIAFRTSRAFPAGAAEPSTPEVLDAVSSAHIAVELCRSRLAEGPLAPPLWLLADHQMNHMLVLGSEIRGWRDMAFDQISARLSIDGALVHDAIGGYAPVSPLPLLAWLVRHTMRSRGGLPAGSVVTTGSWTGLRWVKPAARIHGEFAGAAKIAKISVELVP